MTDDEYDLRLIERDPFAAPPSRLGVRNVPKPANEPLENEYYRAFLGQGVGMGWGEEGEAWLRSKLPGGRSYEDEVRDLRERYAEFSRRNPTGSTIAEVAGGIVPTAAALLAAPFTGGATAPAAAAGAARTAGALGRLAQRYRDAPLLARTAGVGGTTGAVTGAGTADEGDRLNEAIVGGGLGTTVGVALPLAMQGTGGAYRFLRDRLASSEPATTEVAASRISRALERADMTPEEAAAKIEADRLQGIPSTLANVDPKVAALLERVAPRSEGTERRIVEALEPQMEGSRYRASVQTQQRLGAGNLAEDEEAITRSLRSNADQNYRAAYAAGDVDDPQISQMLQSPSIMGAWKDAAELARLDAQAARSNAIRAGDESFNPRDFLIRAPGDMPDVKTIDYLKRALDARINSLFRSSDTTARTEAAALRVVRDNLRERTKEVVPAYREALERYAGDTEVKQALRSGFEDFNKLTNEEINRMFTRAPSAGGMSDAEKDAFVTGVNRFLYGRLMEAPIGQNAVGRLIRSPEMEAKLRPMFDSPAHFDLFKAALEREGQLYDQGKRALESAVRGGRARAAGDIEESSELGQVVTNLAHGNWRSGLVNFASSVARNSTISEKAAQKLTDMLLSSSPNEVAAAVRILEDFGERAAGSRAFSEAMQTGLTRGVTGAAFTREPPRRRDATAED